jgi:hypothetical protein
VAPIAAHLAVHLRAGRLDRELAAGRPPATDQALALHAERLTRPAARHRLAAALRRLVRCERAAVPVACDRVRGAEPDLRLLASRLDGPGPVAPAGVARARLLVGDGTGPLYDPSADPDALARAAERALTALSG